MSRDTFSQRQGHVPYPSQVRLINDAPLEIRRYLVKIIISDLQKSYSWLRDSICETLMIPPDVKTYRMEELISIEVSNRLNTMEWYLFYDLLEYIYDRLSSSDFTVHQSETYEFLINQGFNRLGIGWQMLDGKIKARGDEAFESVARNSLETMQSKGLETATSELKEARNDLSRRPEPDLSGAIHHAMSALECVARELTGDSKATLGKMINQNPGLIPKPMDDSLSKMWGWASNHARHGNENREISLQEAQLVFGVAAALCSYLSEKLPTKTNNHKIPWER